MKSKTINLILQLFFVILVVAVIATHVRIIQKNELFQNTESSIQGVVGSDENLKVTGKIMATSVDHQLGKSKIPDEKGDIHLNPHLANNSIFLNGKTTINNKLCFKQINNDEKCFDTKNLAPDTLALKQLEFVAETSNKHKDSGKIQYGGLNDNNALNIVGAGQTNSNRRVRVWDNLCIGNECIDATDIQKIRNIQQNIDEPVDALAKSLTTGSIQTPETTNKKCWDIPNSRTANGTPVNLWTCNGGDNQKFYYTPYKQLKSILPGNKCIHVSNNRIQIQNCDKNDDKQKFDYDNNTNVYKWKTECITTPNTNNGIQLQVSKCANGTQKFIKQ
jgi:hypothetical protein